MSENIKYMPDNEFAALEKDVFGKVKARNKAVSLIQDAKARYVKEKTRARSKKAAVEKDAAVNAPKFKCLADFEVRQDIQESYGMGVITEAAMDRLEALWDEREALKAASPDGVYTDAVTECLDHAVLAVMDMFENEIEEYETADAARKKLLKKDNEQRAKDQAEYNAWKNGWGKYSGEEEE